MVELDDIAHAFPPGHRIAVSISTTYWPVAWPSPELATLTVDRGETALDLPVRPPSADDATLRAFDPPEMAPLPPRHPPPGRSRATRAACVRDLLSGRMVVDFPRWTYRKDMHDIGQTQRSSAFARYEIIDGDPLSATLDHRVRRGDGPARCHHHPSQQGQADLRCHAFHHRDGPYASARTARPSSNGTGMKSDRT